MAAINKTFKGRVEITQDENGYRAAIARLEEDKTIPVGNFTGLTPADVFFRFGVKVEVPPAPTGDLIADLKEVLSQGIDNLPDSKVISRDRVIDIFLDTISKLGYEADKEEEETT